MFHPMKIIKSLFYLNLLFLFACSGGTGGTGLTSSNVVVGTITQVNSTTAASTKTASTQQAVSAVASTNIVIINGIQFDVTSSAITLDGTGGTEADLRVGMVATIKGTVSADGMTGRADTLSVKEVIKGPVTNVDTINNTITVLGHTIQVSTTTHWDNVNDITGLAISNIVETSGYLKNNNVIAATRVELLTGNETEFKVIGSISNLSTLNSTFSFGTLNIEYLNANLNNIPNNTLADGMFVEAKGSYDIANDRFVATQINADKLEINDADNMELQGFVTSVTSVTNISVNHIPVTIDGNTQFHGGGATDIVAGVLVSVRGPLVNNVLIANEISFENSVKVTAVVNAVGTNSLTLTGLSNLNISVDASTELDGNISSIAELLGYTVTIHGNLIPSNNSVVATQITVESTTPSPEILLQGPVTSIVNPMVTILGINIDTSSFSDADFIVEGAITNSQNYFFSLVSINDVITATGTQDPNSGLITWQFLVFENSM